MTIQLRLSRKMNEGMRKDLRRRHPFAHERVGFLYCRFARTAIHNLVILGFEYRPVPDEQYIDDSDHGAVIDECAFRDALAHAYDNPVGIFHIHLHDHRGSPTPSTTDYRETALFVPDFFHGRPTVPHGAIILSKDRASGRVWAGERRDPQLVTHVRVVGAPLEQFGRVR